MAQPHDAQSRNDALDIERSWLVTAPAGSGKTGLLTLRVLKLLAHVEQPEEVLAITFTRKAAAEMQERIMHALESAEAFTQGLDKTSALKKIASIEDEFIKMQTSLAYSALMRANTLDWQILVNSHRLKIKTIDGFCKETASQMPLLSGIDANIQQSDVINDIYEDAVKSLIDDYMRGEHVEDIDVLIEHFNGKLDSLSNNLTQMLANRDQWLPFVVYAKNQSRTLADGLHHSLEQLAIEKCEALNNLLAPYAGELLALTSQAARNIKESEPTSSISLLEDVFTLPAPSFEAIHSFWQPLKTLLLTTTNTYRKSVSVKVGFPAGKAHAELKNQFKILASELHTLKPLLPMLIGIGQFPSRGFNEYQLRVLKSLLNILPLCASYLNLSFQKFSKVDFTQVALAALNALGIGQDEPTDLTLALDYKLKHILIDEFQDTSIVQYQLLELLMQGWQPDDGRTVFLVGDGMQSCYLFRNAKVGIFLNVREHGLPNVMMHNARLTTNFRSSPTIVNWVNACFSKAFPLSPNTNSGAVTYEVSHAFLENSSQKSSYVKAQGFLHNSEKYSMNESSLTKQDAARSEADYILKEIQTLQRKDKKIRCAILVKSKKHLTTIIEVLREKKCSYQAVDIDPLISRPVIQDLLIITRIIHNPTDHNAWLAFLRAPYCALSLKELSALVGEFSIANECDSNSDHERIRYESVYYQLFNEEHLAYLSDDSRVRFIRARDIIHQAIESIQRDAIQNAVEKTWFSLGAPLYLTDTAELENIDLFFNLLAKHNKGGRVENWENFSRALEKLFAKSLYVFPQSLSDTTEPPPPIELMTMHKSKGLEFDAVFLPALTKTLKADSSQLLNWETYIDQHGDDHIIFSPLKSLSEEKDSQITQFIKSLHKTSLNHEQTRLLYVACTRAKSCLYLTGTFTIDEKAEELTAKDPARNSVIANIWPIIKSSFEFNLSQSPQDQAIVTNTPPNQQESHLTAKLSIDYLNDKTIYADLTASPYLVSHDEASAPSFNNAQFNVFEEVNKEREESSIFGTAVHRILHDISLNGLTPWQTNEIQLRAHWQTLLEFDGLNALEAQAALDKIVTMIQSLKSDHTAQWIFSTTHRFSRCEWEVHYGEPVRKVIIDRFFIEKSKRIAWVIDHKTSQPKKDESLEAFLDTQALLYRQQLTQYRDAIQAKNYDFDTLITALYFPFLGVLHEVSL